MKGRISFSLNIISQQESAFFTTNISEEGDRFCLYGGANERVRMSYFAESLRAGLIPTFMQPGPSVPEGCPTHPHILITLVVLPNMRNA